MLELQCGTSITIRNILNQVQIGSDGSFQTIIKAYVTANNPNPVIKFRLIPKRSGWIYYHSQACTEFNLKNFDVTPSDIGVESQRISTYNWYYNIRYSSQNSTRDYFLYWQTMIQERRSSNKIPFNSYLNYKCAAVYNGTPNGNFFTVDCGGGKSIIIYPELSVYAQYADAWFIFHEMAHQWHNST